MAETTFAKQLLTLRKQRGITQEKLAGVLGVSAQAVSKWENGSFPEGDLLPAIADYFEVSIDYLYGRDSGKISLDQQVLNEMKKNLFMLGGKENTAGYFEQMLQLEWAMQLASWGNSKDCYQRPSYDLSEGRVSSVVTADGGFSYLRMNRDMEFQITMKEPEDGFLAGLPMTPEMIRAFEFLGDKEHLKIAYFLLSMKPGECVESAVVAKCTGVSGEKTEAALDYLAKGGKEGSPLLNKVSILDEKGKSKKAYICNYQITCSLLIVLAGMDFFVHPPQSFNLSVNNRNNAWFTGKPGEKEEN